MTRTPEQQIVALVRGGKRGNRRAKAQIQRWGMCSSNDLFQKKGEADKVQNQSKQSKQDVCEAPHSSRSWYFSNRTCLWF